MVENISDDKKVARPKIGLALGGGGAKGIAHIGVLRALKEYDIPVDFIAGTSAGSLVGAWYAMNGDIDSIIKTIKDIQNHDGRFLDKVIIQDGKPLLKNREIISIIDKHFGDVRIEDCKIPFIAIGTDSKNGECIRIDSGLLKDAVKASSALPMIFDPIDIKGKMVIDGGLVDPVPVDIVRDMGADFVIAVDVCNYWFDVTSFSAANLKWNNLYSLYQAMLSVLSWQISRDVLKKADVVIRPPVLGFALLDFRKSSEIIDAGYREARAVMPGICEKLGCIPPKRTQGEKFIDFLFGFEE